MYLMEKGTRVRSVRLMAFLAAPAALTLALLAPTPAYANVTVTQVSHDIFTDSQAQHNTEVEPDTLAVGSTIISAFQVGRVSGGGASDIGWARSANGGATWTHGYLPGITGNVGGPFGQASDAAVAYDAKHKVWLISSLGISSTAVDVLTSRSTNGGLTWSNPVVTAGGSNDKNWIVCDDTASSPHYGNCYTEYDTPGAGDALEMQTSTNGGTTWGPARAPSGNPAGIGGQPVVLPNGDVVVPYESLSGQIRSFRSTNGGTSWGSTVFIANISHHNVAGGLRESPLPSAETNATGTVYVAWSDCRFRSGCSSNDIVLSKSITETTWSAPVRVPIDGVSSTVDHFAPGLGVDRSTSGSSTRIGLSYYYYPKANCSSSTCRLDVGYISSINGGATWSAAVQVAGPMSLSWLPNSFSGLMFGDYIATAVLAGGKAYPVLSIASAPSGSTFNQAMYIPTGGLAVTGGTRRASAAHAHAFRPYVRNTLPTAR
jgi:hypothetical protein